MTKGMTTQQTISILGSGWLGLPLAEHLVKQGYSVSLSTRDTAKFPALQQVGANPCLFDIDQISDEMMVFLQADLLIINITSKNQTGFQNLIEHIAHSPIKQVLFISSTSVYQDNNMVVTEAEGAESTESALYQIEQRFQQCSQFDTTVLRLSGLIGYQRHPGRFFAKGKTVSNPDAPVNLIHRDDCIGIIVAIIKQAAWGEVFNGCADSHPTKRDFYRYARQLLGQAPPIFADSTQSQYKIVSNDKIKTQLGYQLIYPDLMNTPFTETG
jgi:nucleoside-diphosphate-sugar epimerase